MISANIFTILLYTLLNAIVTVPLSFLVNILELALRRLPVVNLIVKSDLFPLR